MVWLQSPTTVQQRLNIFTGKKGERWSIKSGWDSSLKATMMDVKVMECRRRVNTLVSVRMHDWGSWGMEVTGVWGGCPASFCHVTMSSGTLSLRFFRLIHISRVPTIFISQVLSVKKTNKKQFNSFCICLLNQNWNFKRESRDIYLWMFLDRKLWGVADGAGFLWLRGIQGVFSCSLPTANSVALSLPFGVFGSTSAISPLLFKLNLRKSTWTQLVLIQQKLVCTKIEHMWLLSTNLTIFWRSFLNWIKIQFRLCNIHSPAILTGTPLFNCTLYGISQSHDSKSVDLGM